MTRSGLRRPGERLLIEFDMGVLGRMPNPELKARAKGGDAWARQELAVRGIYPKRLYREGEEGVRSDGDG